MSGVCDHIGGTIDGDDTRRTVFEFVRRCGQDLRLDAMSAGGLVTEWGSECVQINADHGARMTGPDSVARRWRVTQYATFGVFSLYGTLQADGAFGDVHVDVEDSYGDRDIHTFYPDEIAELSDDSLDLSSVDDIAYTLSSWLRRAIQFHTGLDAAAAVQTATREPISL